MRQVVEILGEIELEADFTYPEFNQVVEEGLSQVILEIARNTARHSKATRFYLSFRQMEESIEFDIGDNGIGGVKPKDFRFGLASIDELLIQISTSYSSSSTSDGSSFKFQIKKLEGYHA